VSGSPVSVIVETLEASGVRFRLDGERIKARLPEPSPPEVLEALETLRARRSELIALLRERPKQTLAPCGSPRCAGCYEVEPGKFLHPPRVGAAPVRTEVQRLSPEAQPAIGQPCAHCAGQGVCACPACNLRRVSDAVPCCMCEPEKRQVWLAATRPTGTSQVWVQ
jgi:hypothetical protein